MATFNGTNIDDIYSGTEDADQIDGNGGNDDLKGNGGNDTINGGSGDDLIQGGLGLDTLDGGAGIDQVDYSTFNGDGIYNLVAGNANLGIFTEQILNFESIIAGNGNDIITLTDVALPSNIFYTPRLNTFAGGGNDLVNGGASNDYIYGGDGNDTLNGSAGNDTIQGGTGNDIIQGGVGNDIIQGGLGQDQLDGGDGIDRVDYRTFSGNGTYDLTAGTAILAGAFTEQMTNFENISTGDGNDTITGSSFANELSGGGGNDIIYGGAGNDIIQGYSGNDYIQGGLGQDRLDGGDNGSDTVDYTTFNGGGTYDLTAGTAILAGAFIEQMTNFENIYTGAGNDIITGTSGRNKLYGGAGEDNISGGDGDDYIQGGLGQDYLNGGAGFDTVDYTTFSGNGTYDLGLGTANLGVGVFTETMLNFESIYAGTGNDDINGSALANSIYAGAGNDRISANDGNDFISGGDGDDTIYGDAGNDSLSGNAGNDVLFGNAGADSFKFGDATLSATNTIFGSIGKDTIYDFTRGSDKIVLSSYAFNLTQAAFSANSSNISFQSVANDALADISTAAIVYSRDTGNLFHNPNGTGTGFSYGGNFANVFGLAPLGTLDTSDFIISTDLVVALPF